MISALIALLVAACASPSPAASEAAPPSPSASAATTPSAAPSTAAPTLPATPIPSDEPPASPQPPSGLTFLADSFVRVTTDGLRVRSLPGVSDESKKLEPLLWDGEVAFVIDGPVAASGYEWYQIRPLGEVDLQYHPDPPALGWVAAAGKDGEPWLAPYPIECQPTPLDWLAIDGFEYPPSDLVALGCFGSAIQRFQAWFLPTDGGCGADPRWAVEPAWIDPCRKPSYGISDPSDGAASDVPWLAIAIDPDVDLSVLPSLAAGESVLVDVQGRYDHPDAGACRSVRVGSPEDPEPPAELVVLGCRAQFAATEIRVHVDE